MRIDGFIYPFPQEKKGDKATINNINKVTPPVKRGNTNYSKLL
jgi:hypothetical protein